MTDKQIIDVTKCIHFDKSDIPNGCTCYWDGECNHYCYYKQLKRKEQEYNKLYIQLKTDEEYHKEEENTLRKIIKNKEERNVELYKENKKLKQEVNTLEQALDEIKRYRICEINDEDGEEGDVILGIINETEEQNNG